MGADFLARLDSQPRATSRDDARLIVSLMDSHDMYPTLRRNSLLILGPTGYDGERLYSLPVAGVHTANIRRLTTHVQHECSLSIDGRPEYTRRCTPQEFLAANPRPVLGAVVPFHHDFERWLRRQHERAVYGNR